MRRRISWHESRVLRCAGPAAAHDGARWVGTNQSEDFAMKERQPSTRELRLVFKELKIGPLKGEGLLPLTKNGPMPSFWMCAWEKMTKTGSKGWES